jgi:membrane protease YdiL (CAAX protease family)
MAGRAAIRWSEPIIVLIVAAVIWLVVAIAAGLISAGFLALFEYSQEKIIAVVTTNFYMLQIYVVLFYLALLLALRRNLRRRHGRTFLAGYFPAIGVAPVGRAALSGFLLAALFIAVIAGLTRASLLPLHRTAVGFELAPRSLARLGIVLPLFAVLVPLAEEAYFRGLLLDWLQQRLSPLCSLAATALIFAVVHAPFLRHPGLLGWVTTAALAALGAVNAIWAQRTRSLRAPAAAHASYNATVLLAAFLLR